MKNQISKWLSIVVPIVLGIGIIVYQYNKFTESQINEIIGYFKNADYFYVVLAVFIGFIGNALRAYRWLSLIHI